LTGLSAKRVRLWRRSSKTASIGRAGSRIGEPAGRRSEQEQAVREARETTKKEVTEELNEQFKKTLEQATSALKSEASTELARVQEQLDQFRIFADAQKLLGEVTSQPEILARFLRMTEPFAPALAVYVAKNRRACALENPRQSRISRDHFPANDRSRVHFKVVSVRGKKVAAACARSHTRRKPGFWS